MLKIKSVLRGDYPEIFEFLDEGKVHIKYIPRVRSFHICLARGLALQEMYYCPWTGKKLPGNLHDEFWELAGKHGAYNLDDIKDLPEEMKSEEWWVKRGL